MGRSSRTSSADRSRRSLDSDRDHRHAAAGLHPLPAAGTDLPRDRRPRRGRDRLRLSATASALAAPARDARPQRAGGCQTPQHVQLTTGDVGAFSVIAERLFGAEFAQRRAGRSRGRRMTGDAAAVDAAAAQRSSRSRGRAAAWASPSARPGWPSPARYLARRAQQHRAPGPRRLAARRAARRQPAAQRARRAAALRAAAPRRMTTAARWPRSCRCSRQRLGQPLPGVVERHAVVDRAGWARANITTFEALIDRLEPHLVAATGGAAASASDVARMANRFLTTQQLGFLLGYLGARVLGQYDVALLSAEATPGKLLFVEENIRATAATLGVNAGRLPDLDRAPRGDARLRVRGQRLAAAVPARPPRAPADRRARPGASRSSPTAWAASSKRVREAQDNPHRRVPVARAARAVRRDAAGHEPARRASATGSWTRSARRCCPTSRHDPRPLRGAAQPAPWRVRSFRRAHHRARPEARAVPPRRALRLRCRGGGRPGRRSTPCGAGPSSLPSEAELADPAAWVRRVVPERARALARDMTRVSDTMRATSGPGSGPNGVPAAIGLSPILSARYRPQDLARIADAAPGSRLVHASRSRDWPTATWPTSRCCCAARCRPGVFDRLLSRCAEPDVGPLGHGRRGARPDPGRARARPGDHQRARRVQ